MDAFTLLPIVMAIAVAVLVGAFRMILSTQRKSVARLLALPTFDEYRNRHPSGSRGQGAVQQVRLEPDVRAPRAVGSTSTCAAPAGRAFTARGCKRSRSDPI